MSETGPPARDMFMPGDARKIVSPGARKEELRRRRFAQPGAPPVTIFASPDHPNVHALLIDVTDMGAFQAWITSPEAAVAKAEDGVLDEGFTVFTPRK